MMSHVSEVNSKTYMSHYENHTSYVHGLKITSPICPTAPTCHDDNHAAGEPVKQLTPGTLAATQASLLFAASYSLKIAFVHRAVSATYFFCNFFFFNERLVPNTKITVIVGTHDL